MTDRAPLPRDPQLAGWYRDLLEVRDALTEMAAALDDGQLRWRPGPDRWSIAECIDHLAVTDELYVAHLGPVVRAARDRGRVGAGPFRLGPVGGWWVRLLSPGTRRMPAPAAFAPAAVADPAQALARYHAAQSGLIHLLGEADGLDLGRIRAGSVVTPLFRLNLAAWLAGLVAHEQRHLAQARRVRSALPGGG